MVFEIVDIGLAGLKRLLALVKMDPARPRLAAAEQQALIGIALAKAVASSGARAIVLPKCLE
jgi:hypothetical protein